MSRRRACWAASGREPKGRAGVSDRAANFVGNIPEIYDRDLGPVLFADFAEETARRIAVGAPAQVLELAAGTGIVTRFLRDLLSAASRVVATDLNAPMLEIAQAKFSAGEAVEFQPADATDLPFPDGSFDMVVCQFGVMFFPDKEKSYREAFRVLIPGGRYVFSVWDAHRHNLFGRIAHELVATFFPTDPPQFFQVPMSYYRLDPIKDALADAGFADFRVTVSSRVKEVADIDRFARAFVFGNPAIEQIEARGGDPEAFTAALASAYRRELGSGPRPPPLPAIIFEARRP